MKITLEDYIEGQLKEMAEKDGNFRLRYEDKAKNMKDCLSYINQQARKAANGGSCVAVDNETVLSWAVHYYQEVDVNPVEDNAASPQVAAPVVADAPMMKISKPKKVSKASEKKKPQRKVAELNIFDL